MSISIKRGKSFQIVTIVILMAIVLTGVLVEICSSKFQWEVVPWVRITFHAVQATAVSMVLSSIALLFMQVAHDYIYKWLSVLHFMKGQKKNKKLFLVARDVNTKIFRYMQPFCGSVLYIMVAYNVSNQAKYYGTELITVDVIFAVIGAIMWILVFGDKMVSRKYSLSAKEYIMEFREEGDYIKSDSSKSNIRIYLELWIVLLKVLLTPIWLYFIGKFCIWLFLQVLVGVSMSI